jgi:hypothetical protein
MKRHKFRWIAAFALAAALSACSGSSSSNAANGVAEATAAPYAVATAKSPCNLPGGWYFQGACTVEDVTSGGAVLVLPSYRGVSVAMTFGANDAASRAPFLLGDAFGDGDISGLLNGRIAFAGFGSTKCLTPSRSPVPCVGKALLYLIVVNGGSAPVTFQATPTISLLSSNGYPGKKCGVDTMVWANPSRGEAAWVVRPFTSEPNGEKLRFDALAVKSKYGNGATFTSFAIVCRP